MQVSLRLANDLAPVYGAKFPLAYLKILPKRHIYIVYIYISTSFIVVSRECQEISPSLSWLCGSQAGTQDTKFSVLHADRSTNLVAPKYLSDSKMPHSNPVGQRYKLWRLRESGRHFRKEFFENYSNLKDKLGKYFVIGP